jgi:predicted RNA binding protein YcfA (HicA-like mRNA interferase family)
MTRLPALSYLDIIRALRTRGFLVVRQRGGHIRLQKESVEGTIKLTLPAHKAVKRGTLRRVINDAGLTRDEFLELL